MSNMDHMLPLWVREAQKSARDARKYRKVGLSNLAEWNDGKVSVLLRVCRCIKGFETEARTINARRRRLAA